ncbi:hypothetical protein GKZ28_09130 [Clostridium chromiireducens]|uniref:Uncharacterized protein n=1 Tax=Clostridium chromiireducens TaxID=225345 RepID=A0A964RLI0_9CLOT|nr:hypothetical protein [Clostridium chromiireducens]MVX63856.1 hypothetical protein [Clostridium chromiireducens]
MENNNTCDGFLCSHIDSCNINGDCRECDSFCTCSACLFDYVPNDDNCYMIF